MLADIAMQFSQKPAIKILAPYFWYITIRLFEWSVKKMSFCLNSPEFFSYWVCCCESVIKSEVNMNCIIVERTSVRYISAWIADWSPLYNIA